MADVELLGHDAALAAVRRLAHEGALAHALLIAGPDGVGKTTFAHQMAMDLTCLSPDQNGMHCGVCRSCVLAEAGSHPDILRVVPAKEETTIGQMRDMRYAANLVPSFSPRRVVIIERGETLNEQAANAILKVLEDAPPHLVLMLLAPSAENLLPTIRSRSIQITLRPVSSRTLTEWLCERGAPEDQAGMLAAYAGGAPGRAVSLMGSPDLETLLQELGQWMEHLAAADLGAALKLSEDLRALAGRARAALPGGEEGRTDRQGIAWVLDALLAALQASLHVATQASAGTTGGAPMQGAEMVGQRWDAPQIAALIAGVNETRRLVLAYAQPDLQIDRLISGFLAGIPVPSF